MKKLFLLTIALAFLAGCSNLYNSTPEFVTAQDAHLKTHALAAQVRGAERESKADEVRQGKRFYANCDTYSRTVADLLVNDYGADPAEVWLVQVDIPVSGFVWEKRGGKWQRIKADRHQVVLYKGLVLDNKYRGLLTVKDLEFDYKFVRKMNMKDQQWVVF